MRTVMLWNEGWLYAPEPLAIDAEDSGFTPVTLPHTNKQFFSRSVDSKAYQFVSTYRKHFVLPEDRQGRRVYLDFDGAMLISTVFLNGALIGTHAGGYTPFSFEITDHLRDGQNTVTVLLELERMPRRPALWQRGGLPDVWRHLPGC